MLLSIPADPYDPDEPEGSKKKSQYLSPKGFMAILGVIIVLMVLLYPIYIKLKGDGEEAFCTQNMKAIADAIKIYSTETDDLMPPTHNMEADGDPSLIGSGRVPDSWVSKIQRYMTERQNFVCPTSKPEERVTSIAGVEKQKTVESSYGFYRGLSSVPTARIPNPAEIVAVAESSNLGALGSYDPFPFGKPQDKVVDGFLIGWDDGNIMFTGKSSQVTRLAFYGKPGSAQKGRHGTDQSPRINAITADGHLKILSPSQASVEHSPPRLKGLWWADPNYFK